MSVREQIEEERQKISSIDRQILQLISERLTVAQKIGQLKKKENLPIRDYSIEQRVLKRNIETAEQLDISTEMTKKLVDLLIDEAVLVQEEHNYSVPDVKSGKKILIIGGLGKMGNWLAEFFISSGYEVTIFDKSESNPKVSINDFPKIINDYDFIAISTPLNSLKIVLNDIIKLKPRGTVFDIGSLKSHILDEIQCGIDQGLKITSLHPMFGPNIRTLNGRNVILASCGSEEADKKLKELFMQTACNLVEIPIADHDKYMSISLGLSHAINLLFGLVVTKTKFDHNIDNFASTTFLKQLITTKEVFSENPELYYSIQKLNFYKDTLYANLAKSVEELKSMVDSDDPEAFTEFMKNSMEFFKEL